VRRLGEVGEADLPAIYAGAACLGYVSECEGFGLPVIEAMAAGTPVVTSNTSALPEVAGGAALLVDPWSIEAIADGLERVLSDTALADALRVRGRARSGEFDWSRTAAGTEEIYRQVCGLDYSSRVPLSPGPASAPTHSPAALAQ
jgi:alpha-1,3-rhamnosyl/mannosyltransferase